MEKRCYGCMHIKGPEPWCGNCGCPDSYQNAQHQLPVGTILHGKYMIGKALGQGGFGITYLGWDQELEAPVAIKEYYPSSQVSRTGGATAVVTNTGGTAAFHEGRERFLREARTLARLRRLQNIVQVYGFFEENNTAYIVMEYLEGITLEEHIRQRGGRLSVGETFAIMRPIISAMSQVHQEGMIHRDISPDNIMLQAGGTVKLLDFGTARDLDQEGGQLARSTQAVLKWGFAPPEQYTKGRAIDQRVDVYAVCTTIYYCLTGSVPMDALDRLVDQRPIPWAQIPGLGPNQIRALGTGTALKAEDRYPDMKTLEDALFLNGYGQQNPNSQIPYSQIPNSQIPNSQIPNSQIPYSQIQNGKPPYSQNANVQIPYSQIPNQAGPVMQAKKKSKGKRIAIMLIAAVLAVALGVGGWWAYQNYQYDQAVAALENQEFDTAYEIFDKLGDFEDSADMLVEVRYQEACWLLEEKEYVQAYDAFALLGDYKDSQDHTTAIMFRLNWTRSIAAGRKRTIALKPDGTVVCVGYPGFSMDDITHWYDITNIAAGYFHNVGVMKNGSVVAIGYNEDGQCDVDHWTNVVAVSAGGYFTVGLKEDGSVVATGDNDDGQCDVDRWTDVVAIATGYQHAVGLRADGTVVATGNNRNGQCNVSDWTDIVAVAAGYQHTVGLKADGTVVAAGKTSDGQCDVETWTNIVEISACDEHTVGLRADGTVVATGTNEDGRCDVSGWSGIVSIAAGQFHTVGLKADGTVVSVGLDEYGELGADVWRNILVPERRPARN